MKEQAKIGENRRKQAKIGVNWKLVKAGKNLVHR
jgi:hypothetical protein